MKNIGYKKGIVFGIIILFIGMSVVPSTAIKVMIEKPSTASFDGNTLYVGGSGPNNYTSIQSAVDDSVDGDTVFVYDDSSPYYESILMNKSINLVGENNYTTIIDASESGDVIHISVDFVHVSGFTIQDCEKYEAGIDIRSDNNVIDNNIITLNYDGLNCINQADNNLITNNTITFNFIGIVFYNSHNNTMSNNDISFNDFKGIYFV